MSSQTKRAVQAFVQTRSVHCAACWSDSVRARRGSGAAADMDAAAAAVGAALPGLPVEVQENVLSRLFEIEAAFLRILLNIEAGSPSV